MLDNPAARFAPAWALAAIAFAPAAFAGSSCYEQEPYPAVLRLEATQNGFRAYGVSPDREQAVQMQLRKQGLARGDPGEAYTHPVIAYGTVTGFSRESPLTCHTHELCPVTRLPAAPPASPCMTGLPPHERLVENARSTDPVLVSKPLGDVSQEYGACHSRDGRVWFGVRYYQGEGITGIGGVGRYDPKSGRMELRRPAILRESSVTQLLHDGENLWLGTAGDYECTGTPPTLGLVRYDWNTGGASAFLDENDGPCGLLVNDFLQLGDDVWVATDLGLSRWNRASSTWKNYAADPGAGAPMRETSCAELYRRLMDNLPRSGWSEAMPAPSPYHQFTETLAQLKPRSVDAATLADSLFKVFFPDEDAAEAPYRAGNFTAAAERIGLRAETGDMHSQYNLGTLYAHGAGVRRDFDQAAAWLRKSAAQGHAQAQANLGLLLLNGARTRAQWAEAKKWLSQASAQGSNYAKTALLLMENSKLPASVGD